MLGFPATKFVVLPISYRVVFFYSTSEENVLKIIYPIFFHTFTIIFSIFKFCDRTCFNYYIVSRMLQSHVWFIYTLKLWLSEGNFFCSFLFTKLKFGCWPYPLFTFTDEIGFSKDFMSRFRTFSFDSFQQGRRISFVFFPFSVTQNAIFVWYWFSKCGTTLPTDSCMRRWETNSFIHFE